MSKPKILITGATGFIGGHILQALISAGYECIALVRKSDRALSSVLPAGTIIVGPLEESIGNIALFKNVGAVIHCAARVHQMRETAVDPMAEYRRVNRDLTNSLARAAISAGVKRFIFFSTIKVMGDIGKRGKVFTETDMPRPTDPYGQSKLEAEEGLRAVFQDQSGCRGMAVRLPMVYGEGNKGNMLGLLAAASKKRVLPLKAATAKRSMVNVGNIASAVLTILSSKPMDESCFETYFLTDGTDHSSADLYSAIYKCMNNGANGLLYVPAMVFKTGALLSKKMQGIVSRLFDEYRCSSELFQKTYSWKPPVTLEQGVQKLVAWYKERGRK
jgi:nucleoside-diphosphate-sugar epimerase